MIGCWRYIKVKEGLWVEDLSGHLHRQEIQKEEWVGRGSNESHVGQVEFEMPLESNKQRPGLVCSPVESYLPAHGYRWRNLATSCLYRSGAPEQTSGLYIVRHWVLQQMLAPDIHSLPKGYLYEHLQLPACSGFRNRFGPYTGQAGIAKELMP